MKNRIIDNKLFTYIIRIFIGGVFVASAVLKYLSIDIFDLYVYEHNIFNLALTETLTRCLIACEFCMGVMLIFGLKFRWAYFGALLLLTAFTIYLVSMPLLFDVDPNNCHCFGDKIILNRTQSIIKNIILIVLLLLLSPKGVKDFRKSWIVVLILAILSLGMTFAFNPPDYIYTAIYGSEVRIDEDLYHQALAAQQKQESYSQGRQIICMYSTACSYCRKSARRVQLMAQREHWNTEHIKLIFWRMSNDSAITRFYDKQQLSDMEYTTFTVDTFLNITKGQQPVILLSDNGKIIKSIDYIAFSENEITRFLEGKE